MHIGKVLNHLNSVDKGYFSKLNALSANPEEFNSSASTYALYAEMEATNDSLKQVVKTALTAMEAKQKVATIVDTVI